MFKKAGLLLILCISVSSVFGQYEDDAPAKDTKTDTLDDTEIRSITEKLTPGMEFMINGNSGVFFAELSPFIGIRPVNPLMAGVGLHGSFLGAGRLGNYSYYGGYAFGRIIIADQVFIHGEYRLLNGAIPGPGKNRIWVSSPAAGIGIMYGEQVYLLIGYAFDTEFQDINPLGGLIYRLGVYF